MFFVGIELPWDAHGATAGIVMRDRSRSPTRLPLRQHPFASSGSASSADYGPRAGTLTAPFLDWAAGQTILGCPFYPLCCTDVDTKARAVPGAHVIIHRDVHIQADNANRIHDKFYCPYCNDRFFNPSINTLGTNTKTGMGEGRSEVDGVGLVKARFEIDHRTIWTFRCSKTSTIAPPRRRQFVQGTVPSNSCMTFALARDIGLASAHRISAAGCACFVVLICSGAFF